MTIRINGGHDCLELQILVIQLVGMGYHESVSPFIKDGFISNGTNTANIFMHVIQGLNKNLLRRPGGLQDLSGLLLRLCT